MNEYLVTVPFDLYELHLFKLVARTASFTQAARQAGLTQSAMTRQIRGMEKALGVDLFERTTRHVLLTAAGRLLLERATPILDATGELVKDLQQQLNLVPKILRVGVARSIGLGYLPGYFFGFQKKNPSVRLHISQGTSNELLAAVETGQLDAGLLCPPRALARSLQITHRFADGFTFIAPLGSQQFGNTPSITVKELKRKAAQERWLMIRREGNTGVLLNRWLKQHDWELEPAMELDSFDMIVNLVSLGLGVSLVPYRVLPLYAQRRNFRRLSLKNAFTRDLAVVVRKNRILPEPLRSFVEGVLF
jgi:DNA-binding transcriptional LysR family regulator